jgi:hypothetical protein
MTSRAQSAVPTFNPAAAAAAAAAVSANPGATHKGPDTDEVELPMVRHREVDWFIIQIGLANDNEPRRVFVGGCEQGDYEIERGKYVMVPEGVIERLENAVTGVAEQDPIDPMKTVVVQRRRFNFTVAEKVGRSVNAPRVSIDPQTGRMTKL